MVKVEDILFWILIFVIVGMSVWLAFGSPDFEKSLLMIVIFVATSEILLWKALFAFDKRNATRLFFIDKKTAVGFERIKLGFEKVRSDFKEVNNKLKNIEIDVGDIKDNIININKKLK